MLERPRLLGPRPRSNGPSPKDEEEEREEEGELSSSLLVLLLPLPLLLPRRRISKKPRRRVSLSPLRAGSQAHALRSPPRPRRGGPAWLLLLLRWRNPERGLFREEREKAVAVSVARLHLDSGFVPGFCCGARFSFCFSRGFGVSCASNSDCRERGTSSGGNAKASIELVEVSLDWEK